MNLDDITKLWTLDKSDELAVRNGCWFDPGVGGYAVWWIERYCRLYEGEYAGEPMRLRGAHSDPLDLWEIPDEFDEEQAIARSMHFITKRRAGEDCDWQYEFQMRMYGWQRHSRKWDRPVRRFRYASIWVAKKNKKTPTMSANGLYLECGDGEPGQKVFLLSKDANQVRKNAALHIHHMVNASDDLGDECKLNLSEMSVEHLPTGSLLIPLSSAGSNNQKSKEGLNGSALVDETHVVDRGLMKRTSRMGISRAEPVLAEFSTAGNDPDSYGKERFDYAERVAAGTVEDDSLLVMIYAAPQDLTDEDLAKDPIKYGKMANPAWGHTIDEDEYMADYTRSLSSPSELLDFKMYRLNIWQNSASPWIKPEHWQRGRREFTRQELAGRECYSALDLASVSDFASLCLCFPESEHQHRYLWWYWIPEETARNVADKIPVNSWLASPLCNLILTPGARIDYGYIRSTVRDLAKEFQINELAYDDWNAEQTTQEISEGVTNNRGEQVEEATGIPRVDFPQGMKAMNEPTKAFETAVVAGNVLHNGDPLTAWMFQNATIKPDVNGNYKPLKPGKDSLKKIDGVIVGIMSRARAVVNQSTTQGGLILA